MSNSTFEHVERRTIAADVRERIIDAIRRDELKVGDLLPAERVLCDEFGVGRTSVREAIQGLIASGYVVRKGNRAVIASAAPALELAIDTRKATISNLFEVRRVIEPALAGLVAERASASVRRQISEIANRQAIGIEEFRLIDREFHQAIAAACENPVLLDVYEQALASLFSSEEFASLLYDENNKDEVIDIIASSSKAHLNIAAAILAGNRAMTETAVSAHLWDVEQRMLERLK